MKRAFSLIICVLLVLSITTISSFAEEQKLNNCNYAADTRQNADGSNDAESNEAKQIATRGAASKTIVINGVNYTATLYLNGSLTTGVRSVFYTSARCIRTHYNVSVCFNTQGTGHETYTGGYRFYQGIYDQTLSRYVGLTGTTYSGYVTYQGNDIPTSLHSFGGTGKLVTVDQDGTTHSYNFAAGS